MSKFTIWEGVESTYNYHISDGGRTDTLCGNTHVMTTGLPLSTWGMKTHIGERYCSKCSEFFKQKNKEI